MTISFFCRFLKLLPIFTKEIKNKEGEGEKREWAQGKSR